MGVGRYWSTGIAVAALAAVSPSVASGQDVPDGVTGDAIGIETEQLGENADSGVDWLYAPVPFANPSAGLGIAGGAAAFYTPEGSSHQWITGGALYLTQKGGKGILVQHSMYLGGDRIRLKALGGYTDDSLDYYGIGDVAGDLGDALELHNKQFRLDVDSQFNVAPNLFAGVRYRLKTYDAAPDEESESGTPPPPASELDSTMSMLGPVLTYDTRDDHSWPRSGVDLSANWLFGVGILGNSFSHSKLSIDLRGFVPLGEETVLAGRAALCSTGGTAPWYDLCLFGGNGNLRGYKTGRWRDDASWAVQGEVRHFFTPRWGGVAFLGAGVIGSSVGRLLTDGNLLPGAGIGARFRPFKDNDVTIRLDFAVGKDGKGIYLGIGEAF